MNGDDKPEINCYHETRLPTCSRTLPRKVKWKQENLDSVSPWRGEGTATRSLETWTRLVIGNPLNPDP